MANNEGVDIIIKATDQYTATINKISASNELFGKSIKNIEKEIAALETYMIKLVTNGMKPTSGAIKLLQTNLDQLRGSLTAAQNAANGATGAIAGSANSLKNSNKQWTALSLVVQDLPYGFRGIQNNLPALFGSLATGAGAAYFAFSAVVAAITAWDMGLFKVFETTKKATDAQDEYNKALNSAVASGYGEISQVKALISVVNNQTISIDKRKDALKKLQDEYPAYFKNMSLEKTSVDDLSLSVGELTKAIIARAEATAMTSEIEKIAAQRYNNTKAIEKNEMAITNLKNSLVILSKESGYVSGGFGADAKKLTSPYTQALIEIQKLENANKKLEGSNESLQNSMSLLQNSINFRAGISAGLNTGTTNNEPKEKVGTSGLDRLKSQQKIYKDDLDMFYYYGNLIINEEERIAKERARIGGTLGKELKDIEANFDAQRIVNQQEFGRAIMAQADKNTKAFEDDEKQQLQTEDKNYKERLSSLTQFYTDRRNLNTGDREEQRALYGQEISDLQYMLDNNLIYYDDYLKKLGIAFKGWATSNEAVTKKVTEDLRQIGIGIMNALGPSLDLLLEKGASIGEVLTKAFEDVFKKLLKVAIAAALAVAIIALLPGGQGKLAQAGGALKMFGTLVKGGMGLGANLFANGGIVSGPTMGLMGEYPGASTNPEVIAPLDKLKSLIGGSGGGTLEARISGNDLLILMNKANRNNQSTF
jgi:FtsZ-binding cell division protein ZapB